jgi:hypothetical protein
MSITSLRQPLSPEEVLLSAIVPSKLKRQLAEARDATTPSEAAWSALRKVILSHPSVTHPSRTCEARGPVTSSEFLDGSATLDSLTACIEASLCLVSYSRLLAVESTPHQDRPSCDLPKPPSSVPIEAVRQRFMESDGITYLYAHSPALARIALTKAVQAMELFLNSQARMTDSLSTMLPTSTAGQRAPSITRAPSNSLTSVLRAAVVLTCVAHLEAAGDDHGAVFVPTVSSLLLLVRPRFNVTDVIGAQRWLGQSLFTEDNVPNVVGCEQGGELLNAPCPASILILSALACVSSPESDLSQGSLLDTAHERHDPRTSADETAGRCLFARPKTGSETSRPASRTTSFASRHSSTSVAACSTSGGLRDFLCGVMLRAHANCRNISVEVTSLLARVLIGPGTAGELSTATYGIRLPGPDRRVSNVFGSRSLHIVLDSLIPWAEQCEALFSGNSTAVKLNDSISRLAAQGTYAISPLLNDIYRSNLTCGVAREWNNAVQFARILSHAFTAPSTSPCEGKPMHSTRASKVRHFEDVSRPTTQPTKGRMPGVMFKAMNETLPIEASAGAQVASSAIVAPVLSALMLHTSACRAVILSGDSMSGHVAIDGDEIERARTRAVSQMVSRVCDALRAVGLYGGPEAAMAFLQCYGLDVRECDSATFLASSTTVTTSFGHVCRLMSCVLHGCTNLPVSLQHYFAQGLFAQQPTTALPEVIRSTRASLTLRASDAERWVIHVAAGQISRHSPTLRAALCNLVAPSQFINLAVRHLQSSYDPSTTRGTPRHNQPGAPAIPVQRGDSSRLYIDSGHHPAGHHSTTVSLQPVHIAPEQRSVAEIAAYIQTAAAAGLLQRRRATRDTSEVDHNLSDSDNNETDEEDATVLSVDDDDSRNGQTRATRLRDEDEDGTAGRYDGTDFEGIGRPGAWTPLMATHWLCDTAVRWSCRARMFNERDILLAAAESPSLRAFVVAELHRCLQTCWVPVALDRQSPDLNLPWFRSTDKIASEASGRQPRHYSFRRVSLPPVIAAAVADVVSAVHLNVANCDSPSALALLSWSWATASWSGLRVPARPTLHQQVPREIVEQVCDHAPAPNDDGQSVARSVSHSVTTLTQRAGTATTIPGGPSRRQRAAAIEQLTFERDQLRQELLDLTALCNAHESRFTTAMGQQGDLETTVEQQYARIVALANALVESREREAEAHALSSGTLSLLHRERDVLDDVRRRSADVADELTEARESIHALERRLVAERRTSEVENAARDRDVAALGRRIEELEGQMQSKNEIIAAQKTKLDALQRINEAINGLTEQMKL